jgi:hypothetical protein
MKSMKAHSEFFFSKESPRTEDQTVRVNKKEAMLGSDPPTLAGNLLETFYYPLKGLHLASKK